jgi:hypothetical protein
MAPEYPEKRLFEYQVPNLDIPDPPDNLPYVEFEDYRSRELLKVNGITTSEAGLMGALETQTNVLQAAAAHTLGALGGKAPIPALMKLLSSSEDLVRVESAYALARLGAAEGKDVLVQCLDYPLDAYLFPAIAAGYLAQLGDPQGFQTIVRCLGVDIPAIRMLACKQLYFFVPFDGKRDEIGRSIDVFHEFDRALKDSDTDIQWQALAQLRELRAPDAKAILRNYVKSTSDEHLLDIARTIL